MTFANWLKYPNEHSSHVLSCDVINRKLTPTGELQTDRLLCLKQPIPSLLRKVGFQIPEKTWFLERSILNPKTQIYESKSYSLSMRSLFQAEEICIYENDEESGTLFTQKAQFTVFSYFSKLIEEQAGKRFLMNAERGRKGLESVVMKVGAEAESVLSRVGTEAEKFVNEGQQLLHGVSMEAEKFKETVVNEGQHLLQEAKLLENKFEREIIEFEQKIETKLKKSLETIERVIEYQASQYPFS